MNNMELFDELTFIDDDLILEAHETPTRRPLPFRGLRRAAVLIAAVMMMVVTITAADGDFGILRPHGWVRADSDTDFGMDYENQSLIVHEQSSFTVGEQEIPALSITRADRLEMWTKTECQGQKIQIIQEAMILMPDGQCEYKAQITEGDGEVIAIMDNIVDGIAGEIANVRCTVSVLMAEGTVVDEMGVPYRLTEPEWKRLQDWNIFLPSQLGYHFPTGVDARFPDMKYNYDGRGSASE